MVKVSEILSLTTRVALGVNKMKNNLNYDRLITYD